MKDIGKFQESCRKRVERLGIKAKDRKIVGSKKSYELRDPPVSYRGNFTPENGLLRLQNAYFWDDII